MRVYGRTYDELGRATWNVVETDSLGNSEYVYVTALIQVLKLQLGESPFYANYGIPAHQSVQSQVPPDVFVARIQQQYAGYFANLTIRRVANTPNTLKEPNIPTYAVSVLLKSGTTAQFAVTGIPT